MAQPDEAAAVAEAEVVQTAPEQNQATETTNASDTDDALSFYEEDLPAEDAEQDDLDDDQGDEEEAEPVSAPASLNAEEKEKFTQLPAEAQRAMSEILSRRDRETQQGLEAARSAQREAQRTAADHVANTQRDFAQKFSNLVQAFQPTPPPITLIEEDPTQYLILKAQFDQDLAGYNQLVGQASQLISQSDAHFEKRKQEWMDEEANKLRSIPEVADDAKRPQFVADIRAVGKELGFSDEELSQVSAKDVFALNRVRALKADAEKWREHQKRRNERPRQATGRFSAAPAGNGMAANRGQNDALKSLYPND